MNDKLFHKSLHMAGDIVRQLKKEDMAKPTPCSEWNVHDLTNHLLNEVAWVEPLLAGKTIAEVGDALDGDLVGNDPWGAWQGYCSAAGKAVMTTEPEAVTHLSYADKAAEAYVKEVAADVIVHGWDLAQALDLKYEIDDETAAAVIEATKDILPSAREVGMIGKPSEVAEDANAADRLLAAYGRSANWRS